MSEYDLGTAHGQIKITYDKSGFADARKDIEGFNTDSAALSKTLDDLDKQFKSFGASASKSLADARKEMQDFGKEFDKSLGSTNTKKIKVETEVDRDTFQQSLEKAAAGMRKAIPLNVTIDKDRFAREIAKLSPRGGGKNQSLPVPIAPDEKSQGLFSRFFSSIAAMASNTGSAIGDTLIEFGSMAPGIAGLAGSFGKLFAILGLGVGIFEALVAVGGAVTTTLMAVPAAIGLIGVPIAAIMLGMDGIKKAAASIKPEFDSLKASISGAFEKGMTPVFKQLATIFPQLKVGLGDTATAISGVALGLAKVVTTGTGLQAVSAIIGNVNNAIRTMGPDLNQIVADFLRLAASKAAMQVIVDLVHSIAQGFKEMILTLGDDTLNTAFQGLSTVLQSLVKMTFSLMTNLTTAFSTAAPGIAKFVDGLTTLFNKFDWKAVGKAIGDTFGGIGDALANIPQGTIDAIVKGFQDLAETFKSPEFKTFISNLAAEIPPLMGQLKSLLDGIIDTYNKAKEIFDWAKSNGLIGGAQTLGSDVQPGTNPTGAIPGIDVDSGDATGGGALGRLIKQKFNELMTSINEWFASSGLTEALHKIGDQIANYFTVTLPGQLSGINFSAILQTIFAAGGGGIGALTGLIAGWLTPIATDIKNWFTTTLPGLLGGINISTIIQTVFAAGGGAIGTLTGLVVTWLTPLATSIKNWFTTTLPAAIKGINIGQLITSIFTGGTLGDVIGLVAGWLKPIGDAILNWFTTTLPQMLKSIKISDIIKNALGAIAPGGSGLIGGLGGGSSVGSLSSDQMSGLGLSGGDSGIAASITAQLAPALAAITAFGPQAAAAMTTAMTQVNNAVTTSLATLGPVISAQFTTLGPTIAAALTTAFSTLGATLSVQINNALVGAFTTAFATLGPVLGVQLGMLFNTAMTSGMATIAATLSVQVNNAFTTAFATAFATLGPVLGVQIGAVFTAAFAGIGPSVTTGLTAALAGVVPAVTTALQPITAAVTALGPAITAAANTAFASLGTGVAAGVTKAVAAVNAGKSQIVSAVAAIGPAVDSAVKGQDWKAIGQAICDGILAGVQAGWPALVAAVQQLAMSLLAAALGALGIASPSKEFFWVGEMMTKGWLGGIMSGAGALLGGIGNLIGWIFGMFGGHGHHGGGPTTPPPVTPPPPPPPPPSTGVGWNPNTRPTGASWATDPQMNGPVNVTIDAKTVAEMNSVVDFFNGVQQTARAGRTT